MVVAIFRLLSLPDCCRLCASSRHFSSLLPLAVSLFRIRRLVVREPDFVDVDFLLRSGLADAVREVVVILDGFGQPTIDYLQSLFRVCTRAKSLTFKCASNNKVKAKLWRPLTLFVSGLTDVEELHVDPKLRNYFVMPSSVERCSLNYGYVAHTDSVILGKSQLHSLYSGEEDVAPTLRRIRSMKLRVGDGHNEFRHFWIGLSHFPSLADLTIHGFTRKSVLRGVEDLSAALCLSLRNLSLDVPLTPSDLESLPSLPNLETLALGKLKLRDEEPAMRRDISWPPSMKELRISADQIMDESKLYSWLSTSGFDANRTLERVYIDLSENDWPAMISWIATPRMLQIVTSPSECRRGILRDLLFVIETIADWRDVVAHLRTVESLNCLRLFFADGTGNVMREIAASRVDVEETAIRRLVLADKEAFRCGLTYHVDYEFNRYSFAILSRFARVDSYELHTCLPVIADCPDAVRFAARWEAKRHPTSTLKLHVSSFNVTAENSESISSSFHENVRHIATPLTYLRIRGRCTVDLKRLASVARHIETLEIERGGLKNVGLGDDVDPTALPSFLKLRKLIFTTVGGHNLDLSRITFPWDASLPRPPSLDEIQIHYVSKSSSGGWKYHKGIITKFFTDFGVREFRGNWLNEISLDY